jgi:pimeloyl-ACP methyl ester carboxylesterase
VTTPTILLVHGAWCGDWAYWKLGPCLDDRGLNWVGADLPTCRAADASVGPLDDVAYVRAMLEQIDGTVVVVGKSYGGTVISGATADAPNVRHLVYVAAMMPTAGERFQQTTAAARTPEFARGARMLDDGRMAIDTEVGAACAFSQATEEDRDVWRRHNRPMSFGRDPSVSLDRVGWGEVPSTYVVCTEDRALQVSAERSWAKNATSVLERPWDHSPGVSHPDEVADLLADIAGGLS